MADFLLACAVIFIALAGWQSVDLLYRRFAARHPQLGPFRAAQGCGDGCACGQGSCSTPAPVVATLSVAIDRRHQSESTQTENRT